MPRTPYRNKDYDRGFRNRQGGIFKKSNTFFNFYNVKIGVKIEHQGRILTYESVPGVLGGAHLVADEAWGPHNFPSVPSPSGQGYSGSTSPATSPAPSSTRSLSDAASSPAPLPPASPQQKSVSHPVSISAPSVTSSPVYGIEGGTTFRPEQASSRDSASDSLSPLADGLTTPPHLLIEPRAQARPILSLL
ncbi:hypothetical protein PG988_006521 [Apiospora saccharicola]